MKACTENILASPGSMREDPWRSTCGWRHPWAWWSLKQSWDKDPDLLLPEGPLSGPILAQSKLGNSAGLSPHHPHEKLGPTEHDLIFLCESWLKTESGMSKMVKAYDMIYVLEDTGKPEQKIKDCLHMLSSYTFLSYSPEVKQKQKTKHINKASKTHTCAGFVNLWEETRARVHTKRVGEVDANAMALSTIYFNSYQSQWKIILTMAAVHVSSITSAFYSQLYFK